MCHFVRVGSVMVAKKEVTLIHSECCQPMILGSRLKSLADKEAFWMNMGYEGE
jgi:hypothetical protein